MSTKGSHKRTLNRDEKKLAENWDQIDFKRKPADAKKVKETKIGAKLRIPMGEEELDFSELEKHFTRFPIHAQTYLSMMALG
jgi:hypothetical protein